MPESSRLLCALPHARRSQSFLGTVSPGALPRCAGTDPLLTSLFPSARRSLTATTHPTAGSSTGIAHSHTHLSAADFRQSIRQQSLRWCRDAACTGHKRPYPLPNNTWASWRRRILSTRANFLLQPLANCHRPPAAYEKTIAPSLNHSPSPPRPTKRLTIGTTCIPRTGRHDICVHVSSTKCHCLACTRWRGNSVGSDRAREVRLCERCANTQ